MSPEVVASVSRARTRRTRTSPETERAVSAPSREPTSSRPETVEIADSEETAPTMTSPLAVFTSIGPRARSSSMSPDAVFTDTSPSSPSTRTSVDPPVSSRSVPGGHVRRASTASSQLIWIGPHRKRGVCSIVTTWPPSRSSARTSISARASGPRRPSDTSSTRVRGSSAVVTTTRPLGRRTWRATLPGVSKACTSVTGTCGCRASACARGCPWGASAYGECGRRGRGGLRSRTGAVRSASFLLSALGVALQAVSAAPHGPRIEHAGDRAHEPGVGRDAFLGGCSFDARLERLGETERDAPRVLLSGRDLYRLPRLVRHDNELRLPPGKPDLDARRVELAADLERRLAEEVEQPQVERRGERVRQPASRLGAGVVSAGGGSGQILLDGLDVAFELHCDITMTSQTASVKQHRALRPTPVSDTRSVPSPRQSFPRAAVPNGLRDELPDVVAEDRRHVPVRVETVHGDLGAADHEVGVHARDVDPERQLLLGRGLGGAIRHVRDPSAEGDVAGGVLVEERV